MTVNNVNHKIKGSEIHAKTNTMQVVDLQTNETLDDILARLKAKETFIGSANLLPFADAKVVSNGYGYKFTTWDYASGTRPANVEVMSENFIRKYKVTTTSNVNDLFTLYESGNGDSAEIFNMLTLGEVYTLSCYVESSIDCKVRLSAEGIKLGNFVSLPAGNRVKVQMTFKFTHKHSPSTGIYLFDVGPRFQALSGTMPSGTIFKVDSLKLELGTEATQYTYHEFELLKSRPVYLYNFTGNLLDLPQGYYELNCDMSKVTNAPTVNGAPAGTSYLYYLTVSEGNSGRKQFEFKQSANKIWFKGYTHTNETTITWQRQMNILTGAGSPEGVVIGYVGDDYIDTSGAKFYKKITGNYNTGWKLVTTT